MLKVNEGLAKIFAENEAVWVSEEWANLVSGVIGNRPRSGVSSITSTSGSIGL